jgi:hypothetical protein
MISLWHHRTERRAISIELNLFPATWHVGDFSTFAQAISTEEKWNDASKRASQPTVSAIGGITPPSTSVNSVAIARTMQPSTGNRSSVIRLVMPETEIAASGSLQSL